MSLDTSDAARRALQETATSDNQRTRAGQDRSRIYVHQEPKLRYCGPEVQLDPEANPPSGNLVGSHSERVETHPKGSHAATNSDQAQHGGA